MKPKRFKVSDYKGFQVEGILVKGKPMLSIRQFYATKKDPEFRPGRQGVTIELEAADRLLSALQQVADLDPDSYNEVNYE